MPLSRVQRREARVKIEGTEDHRPQEVEIPRETSSPTPTSLVCHPYGQAQPQPTLLRIRSDDDGDDGNDGPPPMWTLTLMGAQATAGALAADDPTATVVVAIPPPPPDHKDGGGGGHKGGISQTTEHLLIAAGSIGATIIIVMIVLAIYTARKRGLTLSQAIKQGKHHVTGRTPPPPPKFEGDWDPKQSFSNGYGTLRTKTVPPPQATMARSGSLQARRDPPINTRDTSFLLESPPPLRHQNSHRRDPSATPSSPFLGQRRGVRHSASTRDNRSVDDDASHLVYPDAQKSLQSPLPPPPTFKQFLNNRPSISGKVGSGGVVSRFSWTNSNGPQTPHDPNRDTYQGGRESYMTSRSSVPRFRTVDSWVNQQTNRIEAQRLKEQFRLTSSTSTFYSGDDENDHVPEVPAMPKNVEQLRESSAHVSASLPLRAPASPPLPLPKGLPGKNIKHERHDTHTTVDTAPIFKQHPGTEVRFSTRSAVPSEILDRGRDPNVLS